MESDILDERVEYEVRTEKIKNIIPISHLLNEYYSACNTLQLPPLIDISDENGIVLKLLI